jgi:hypothetical protein
VTRAQLEHVIRAAGTIANVDDVVVIGSQAVLGEFPDAAAEFLVSNEADVFPREHAERADLIDSTIGEGSPFQRAFGYYAHGVGENTAILPDGWRDRLILVTGANTRFVRGWCLEIHALISPGRWHVMRWFSAKCWNSDWRALRSIRGFEAL